MSRLDDELKRAFQREQPSVDFTERVMRRIASAPQPKAKSGWWRALVVLFEPRTRWVLVGAAAAMLLVVGAYEYWTLRKSADAKITAPLVDNAVNSQGEDVTPSTGAITPAPTPLQIVKGPPKPRSNPHLNRQRLSRGAGSQPGDRDTATLASGEKAKEQLFLAFQIASSTLGETRRLVQSDTLNPSHERSHNR